MCISTYNMDLNKLKDVYQFKLEYQINQNQINQNQINQNEINHKFK